MDESEVGGTVGGFQEVEGAEPGDGALEFEAGGFLGVVAVVQVQFDLTVPGGYQLLEGDQVAVDGLLSVAVLPGRPSASRWRCATFGYSFSQRSLSP